MFKIKYKTLSGFISILASNFYKLAIDQAVVLLYYSWVSVLCLYLVPLCRQFCSNHFPNISSKWTLADVFYNSSGWLFLFKEHLQAMLNSWYLNIIKTLCQDKMIRTFRLHLDLKEIDLIGVILMKSKKWREKKKKWKFGTLHKRYIYTTNINTLLKPMYYLISGLHNIWPL